MVRPHSLAAAMLPLLAGCNLVFTAPDCNQIVSVVTRTSYLPPISTTFDTTTTVTANTTTTSVVDGGYLGTSTETMTTDAVTTTTEACPVGYIVVSTGSYVTTVSTAWEYPTSIPARKVRKRQATSTPTPTPTAPPFDFGSVVLYTCLATSNGTNQPATTTIPSFVTGPNGPAGGAILVTLADTTTVWTSTFTDGSEEFITVEKRQFYNSGSIFQSQIPVGTSFVPAPAITTEKTTTFVDGSVEIVTQVAQDVWASGSISTSTSAIGTSFIPAPAITTSYTTALANGSTAVIGERLQDYLDASAALATNTSILYTSIVPYPITLPVSLSSSSSSALSSSSSSSSITSIGTASTATITTTGADRTATPAGTLIVPVPTGGTITTIITSFLPDGVTEYVGQRIWTVTSPLPTTVVTEPMGTVFVNPPVSIPDTVTASTTTVLSTTLGDGTQKFTTDLVYYWNEDQSSSTIPLATLIINTQFSSDSLTTVSAVVSGITSYIAEDVTITVGTDGSTTSATADVGTYIVGPGVPTDSCAPLTTTTTITTQHTFAEPDVHTETIVDSFTETTTTYTQVVATITASSTATDYTSTVTSTTLSTEYMIESYTATVQETSASAYPIFQVYGALDFTLHDIHANGQNIGCPCDSATKCFGTPLTCRAGAGGFEDCANICITYNNNWAQTTEGLCVGVVYEQNVCWLKNSVPPNGWCGDLRDYATYSGILLNQTSPTYPGEAPSYEVPGYG